MPDVLISRLGFCLWLWLLVSVRGRVSAFLPALWLVSFCPARGLVLSYSSQGALFARCPHLSAWLLPLALALGLGAGAGFCLPSRALACLVLSSAGSSAVIFVTGRVVCPMPSSLGLASAFGFRSRSRCEGGFLPSFPRSGLSRSVQRGV